jgi:hypothetical protein
MNAKTAITYGTGLSALNDKLTLKDPSVITDLVLRTFTGVSLSDNTNFGFCDFECYPKTAEEMALIDFVSYAKE